MGASGKRAGNSGERLNLVKDLPSEIPQSHYKAIFDALPSLLLVLTPDFRMVAANHARFRGTLSTPEEVIGKTVFEIFPDNPADPKATGVTNLRASLERVLALRIPDRMAIQKYDIPRPASEGGGFEERYWSPLNTPVLNDTGEVQYIIHQVEDVTELVRLTMKEAETTSFNQQMKREIDERRKVELSLIRREQELKKQRTELELERDMREIFVATVSHDLRNPLATAKMSTQLALRSGENVDARNKYLTRALRNLGRADQMIQDLLDANCLKAGQKLSIEVSQCDLRSIAFDTLEELSLIHGNRFVLQAPDSVQGYWSCDGLRRILENLCNNAVKYGSPDLPITVTLKPQGDRILFSVHNYGSVIPKEQQSQLFKPFQRAVTSQEKRGWGLGLALVRGLVEAHHGSVEIKSSEAEGTTFAVSLPWDNR